MPVVDIESPLPGDIVGRMFHVMGTLDLRVFLTKLTQAQLLVSPGDLHCFVFQSDGTTPLPNTTISPANPVSVPVGTQIMPFDFTVTRTMSDENDCVVVVMFVPTGTPIGSCTPMTCPRDTVEEFDIVDAASVLAE